MTSRDAKNHAALIAAFRQGLGLTGIAAPAGGGALSLIAAGAGAGSPADAAGVQCWWCRCPADAARVAAAATARLARRKAQAAVDGRGAHSHAPGEIAAAVAASAARLRVALHSDSEICAEAERVITRVHEEIVKLQRSGDLKAVNQSYKEYRMQASARGEKVPPYADWFNKYKAKLVHGLAAALRDV